MRTPDNALDTDLITTIGLHRYNQNMLIPAHTATDNKRVLVFKIVKSLPSTTVYAVMCQSSLPCHGNISTVWRYNR